MSVSEHLRRTVALITAPGPSPREPTRAIGSGFFVSVLESHPEPPYLTRRHEYMVTAGHLVRGEERTFVRLRRTSTGRREGSKGIEEVGIGRWFRPDDDTRDVAAAPLGFSVDDFDHTTIHLDPYRSESASGDGPSPDHGAPPIGLGDPVHVISLLTGTSWAGLSGVPLVRSGTVAAAWQSAPVSESPDGGPRSVSGHLIDTRGETGPGGAPCFLFGEGPGEELPYLIQEARKLGDETLWQKAIERHQETKFFGMLVGGVAEVRGDARTPDLSGIGMVTPREHIIGLIHSEAFRERRAEHMRRAVEAELTRDSPDSGRVPDSGGRPRSHSRRWR